MRTVGSPSRPAELIAVKFECQNEMVRKVTAESPNQQL